ncbi:MAG: hypothetical protein IJS15_13915, partial [Victivallales bacterium]|nr:hypothetical protein [Victivallales bacterium]
LDDDDGVIKDLFIEDEPTDEILEELDVLDIDMVPPCYFPKDLIDTLNDPSHEFFYDWLRHNHGMVLHHYKDEDNEFLMVYQLGKCYLVSFFDNKSGEDWLADEDNWPGENAPYWASESMVTLSPMLGIRKAAKFLKRAARVNATPITIIDDDINIINLDDMFTKWDSLGLYICRKEPNKDRLPPFDWLIANLNHEPPSPKTAIKEMRRAVKAIQHFHVVLDT